MTRFEGAYSEAAAVTVWWCPIVKTHEFTRRPWAGPRTQLHLAREQGCPKDPRVIKAFRASAAARSVRPDLENWETHLTQCIACRHDLAALARLEATEHSFSNVRLRNALRHLGVSSAHDEMIDTYCSFVEPIADDPAGVPRVRVADPSYLRPSTAAFCQHADDRKLAIGFYEALEGQSPFLRAWVPEISVCARYSRNRKPGFREFQEHVQVFARDLSQKEIYIVLHTHSPRWEDPLNQAWFWQWGATAFKTSVRPVVLWALEQRTQYDEPSWSDQFKAVWTSLARLRSGHGDRVAEGLIEVARRRGVSSLGGTFSGDGKVLEVYISGFAKFLFEPFFRPVVNDSGQAILLHCDSGEHKERRAVYSLAVGREEDPQGYRCLCGWSYPKHVLADSQEVQVCNLRSRAEEWIKKRYIQGKRYDRCDWLLRSSPHSYFATKLDDLSSRTARRRQRAQAEAERRATAFWKRKLASFFDTTAASPARSRRRRRSS